MPKDSRVEANIPVGGINLVYETAGGTRFEVYEDRPGVSWDGGIVALPGLGRAARFTDSEGNTVCPDRPEP